MIDAAEMPDRLIVLPPAWSSPHSFAGDRSMHSSAPPAVAALPWEALYDAERGVHLAAASQTPLGVPRKR